MADQEPSEIAQPSEGSLHFPALLIARSGLHGAPLLRALAFAPLVGRNSRLDTPASQPVPKALAVVSLVGHQLLWPLPWSPSPSTRDPDRLERRHGHGAYAWRFADVSPLFTELPRRGLPGNSGGKRGPGLLKAPVPVLVSPASLRA